MLGRSHRFLCITSTLGGGGVNISCSRTQHGDPGSGVRGVNHQATAPHPTPSSKRRSFHFILTSLTFRWLLGGWRPPDPLFNFHIFSVYWLKLFPFPPLCADFKHRHMDIYACIIFSHLHIKDFVIDMYTCI